jgi:hypothetical protein
VLLEEGKCHVLDWLGLLILYHWNRRLKRNQSHCFKMQAQLISESIKSLWHSSRMKILSKFSRVKTKLQKNRKFKQRLAHIENNILKSQT